jgi:hypothetical protein
MRTLIVSALLVLATFGVAIPTTARADDKEPQLSHDVYFALKDNSDAAVAKLVASCKKLLTGHPGAVSFSVGTLAKEMKRPVNDQDFDVALHIVFENKAAHDTYNDSETHKQFVAENKDSFKKVRVFDSFLSP